MTGKRSPSEELFSWRRSARHDHGVLAKLSQHRHEFERILRCGIDLVDKIAVSPRLCDLALCRMGSLVIALAIRLVRQPGFGMLPRTP